MDILLIGSGICAKTFLSVMTRSPHTVTQILGNTEDHPDSCSILPVVSNVFDKIHKRSSFNKDSINLTKISLCDQNGNLLRMFDVDETFAQLGEFRSIDWEPLNNLIGGDPKPNKILEDSMVKAFDYGFDKIKVSFINGDILDFDLVVITDNDDYIRNKVLRIKQSRQDLGWLMWHWSTDDEILGEEDFLQCSGHKYYFKVHRTPTKTQCFMALPKRDIETYALNEVIDEVVDRCHQFDPIIGRVFASAPKARIKPLKMISGISERWIDNRLALCGPAAIKLLPTSSFEIPLAIKGAFILAQNVAEKDGQTVDHGLKEYVKQCHEMMESVRFITYKHFKDDFTRTRPRNSEEMDRFLHQIFASVSKGLAI